MITFSANHTAHLLKSSTEVYWILKLYYNDESAFTGVSDTDRTVNSNFYFGLVQGFQPYYQKLDFFNYTTSTGNMSINIINTPNTISGGRFSDLFSTNNYANRKWELFQTDAQNPSESDQIATGIISGDIQYDTKTIKLSLLDPSSKYHKRLPTALIQNTDSTADHYFFNPPEKNLLKPLPMCFGDFDVQASVPTSPDLRPYLVKSHFPAIVTDQWNATNTKILAQPDSKPIDTLTSRNVYMYKDKYFLVCASGAASATAVTPEVGASGIVWTLYVPLKRDSRESAVSNYANALDDDRSTIYTFANDSGAKEKDIRFTMGRMEDINGGTITGINMLCGFTNYTGSRPDAVDSDHFKLEKDAPGTSFQLDRGANDAGWLALENQSEDIASGFGSQEKIDWDLESRWDLHIEDDNGDALADQTVDVYSLGMEITFTPTATFIKKVTENWETISTGIKRSNDQFADDDRFMETFYHSKTTAHTSPSELEYVYCAGKGREYGEWIDIAGRTNGLNGGAVIEQPVYQIEQMLRYELGTITTGTADTNTLNKLVDSTATFTSSMAGQTVWNLTDGTSDVITAFDSSTSLSLTLDIFPDGDESYRIGGLTSTEIDVATFDISGNVTADAGTVYNALGITALNTEFAFSQWKFISSLDFITKICRQIGSWVWLSGSGKFKIATRRQSGYATTDANYSAIDFDLINLEGISRTPLSAVKNDITVNYNYDYGQEQNLSKANPATNPDTTSNGTGVTGYNQNLKLELDADHTYNSLTAIGIAEMYQAYQKDRFPIISFSVASPRYNFLEITDTLKFDNWPTAIKIYGTAMGTDYYQITKVSKNVGGCRITCVKVS